MLNKVLFVLSFFSAFTILTSFSKEAVPKKAIRTIIIDAGHGIMPNGGYNGARGSYSYEDEICLAVAQKLGTYMAKELPDIKIIQTRNDHNIVDLHERADIANQNRGDLFISIHVNAAPDIQHRDLVGKKTVVSYVGKGKKKKKITRVIPQYHFYSTPNPSKGTETYIWGAHKTEDKEVAIRENAPMLSEENYKENYGDIDPNSPEFIALSLLKTKQFFKRSATLAGFVEEQFAKIGRVSRGQRQRQVGIWVLQATAMPSILVETGYITNRSEEDYLNSEDGQEEMAESITNAVKNYVSWLEKLQAPATTQNATETTSDAGAFLQMIDEKERRHTAK